MRAPSGTRIRAMPQIRSWMCAQSLNMSDQLLLARTRISRVLVTLRHWLGCQRIEFDLCGESRILLREQRRRTAQAQELAGHILWGARSLVRWVGASPCCHFGLSMALSGALAALFQCDTSISTRGGRYILTSQGGSDGLREGH